jgi:hypothetical protein
MSSSAELADAGAMCSVFPAFLTPSQVARIEMGQSSYFNLIPLSWSGTASPLMRLRIVGMGSMA